MPSRKSSSREEWLEVRYIDGYAVFTGYLSMGVRGLSFLVVTWTTVVLLGGFVSMLNNKDFWCLAVITLSQAAGVFNVDLNEKLSYIWKSCWAFLQAMYTITSGESVTTTSTTTEESGTERIHEKNDWPVRYKLATAARKVAGGVAVVVKVLVFSVILCPLYVLYMCGLVISTVISLWRLIQHDYGSAREDPSKANMNPALYTLYSLALVQGLLFCYMEAIAFFLEARLVNKVVQEYRFHADARELVSDYLFLTKAGCAKDPSFAKGRGLITYAVDLMAAESPDSYCSGLRILGTLIRPSMSELESEQVKKLILSPSSGRILQKMLYTLEWRGPRDTEIREAVAKILEHLASDIRLQDLLRGISSLLEPNLQHGGCDSTRRTSMHKEDDDAIKTCQQEDDSNAKTSLPEDDDSTEAAGFKQLLLRGLLILQDLAVDEGNRRVISNTDGLLSKIMVPVGSDLLYRSDHEEWSSIVDASLQVMHQLVTDLGNAGKMMRRQISRNNRAITTMETIVNCPKCKTVEKRHTLAVNILAQVVAKESRGEFIKILLNIFTDNNDNTRLPDNEYRGLAGESLASMSVDRESAKFMLEAKHDFVEDLIRMIIDPAYKRNRILAAQVLEGLYTHDANCGGSFQKLKDDKIEATQKVLQQILDCESETQSRIDKTRGHYSSLDTKDIEGQHRGFPRDNKRDSCSSSPCQNTSQQNEDRKLQVALLCLGATRCEDLAIPFDKIVPGDDASRFLRKLNEMVESTKRPDCHPTADCLEILKHTCKIAISMMKCGGSGFKIGIKSLMESLSEASSKKLLLLDGLMLFSRDDDKPVTTLGSLLEEAKQILNSNDVAIE